MAAKQRKKGSNKPKKFSDQQPKVSEAASPVIVATAKTTGSSFSMGVTVIITLVAVAFVALFVREPQETPSFPPSQSPKVVPADDPTAKLQEARRQAARNVRRLNMEADDASTKFGAFELLETVPHDEDAFTQGLQMVRVSNKQKNDATSTDNSTSDIMYESVGHYGKSALRIVNVTTGEVIRHFPLKETYFAEGLTYIPDEAAWPKHSQILMLTWRENEGFVFDSKTLDLLRTFGFQTTTQQGWGVTFRSQTARADDSSPELIVSDGSAFLHVWDAFTYQEKSRVEVYTLNAGGAVGRRPVGGLNELEYDPETDTVLANVWFNDVIIRINPDTGFVKTIYDLTLLYPPPRSSDSQEAVLNGVSLVPGHPDQLWVTGKLWPYMFRIRLMEPSELASLE